MAKKRERSSIENLKAAAALKLAASARLLVCTQALVRGDLTDAEREACGVVLVEHKAASRALSRALIDLERLRPVGILAREG